MSTPEIKIIATSNVYTRTMIFHKSGDVEKGHCHHYDHATLVSSGSVLFEVLDEFDGQTVSSKEVKSPNLIFVPKEKFHRITSLEDNTVCACIHSLRTIDEEILDPDFLIEPLVGDGKGNIPDTVKEKAGKPMKLPAKL